MHNIIRFWNQNRKNIIIGVIAIVLLVVIIQVLNEIAKSQKQNVNIIQLTEEEKELPTTSIIEGDKISLEITKDNVGLIEEFIEKCNNKDIEAAYSMVTDECKNALFTTQEQFVKGYYDIIFTEKKIYGIENFRNSTGYYTYEVKFYNDALATGKIQENDISQDYITIDQKQGKISINSFIKKVNINKSVEKNGINIEISSKEVYKEYEKYNIKVENNTDKTILMDSGESSKNVYAIGNDNGRYSSFINEIADDLLRIEGGNTRNYKLRINKIYNASVAINTICFDDIVTDEKIYESDSKKSERLKLVINL